MSGDLHEFVSAGYSRLWGWFGLSRASWLTIPRVLMHEMPDEWQWKMAHLLEEFDAEFPEWADRQHHVIAKKAGKFMPLRPELCNYRHPDREAIEALRQPYSLNAKKDVP